MAEKSNPGIKVLVTGAVLGIASAALGGYTMFAGKTVEAETIVSASKGGNSLTAQADKVKETLKRDRTIVDVAPEGATANGAPRLAPLFFSPELWQITLDSEKKNTIVDIYDPAAPSIHGEIPNTWFIANNISDALGRSDGKVLDSDEDGFTNEEEYLAHTCPSAANSYPDLISNSGSTPKLEVVKVAVARAVITADSLFADVTQKPSSVNIRIYDKTESVTHRHRIPNLVPGQNFDLAANEKSGRFTVVRFDTKEFEGSFGGMVKENVVIIRDNETVDKEGRKHEFALRAGKTPNTKHPDYGKPSEKGRRISDTTVTLRTTAGSATGKTFPVQIGSDFTVPGGKADGSELKAKLEEVNGNGSVSVRLEGAESPVNVPKTARKAASPKKS